MEIRRLNTIRGIAALIVVVSHFSNVSGLCAGGLGAGAGQIGVMLFFMLSGFLMAHLYWHEPPTHHNLRRYAAARFARVVPLYILVVLASYFTSHLYDITEPKALASHLLFLHGTSVLWTIPPEVHFYFLFGVSWALCRRFPSTLPLLLISVGGIAFFFSNRSATTEILGFPVTASIVFAGPYFALGCAFGTMYRSRDALSIYQSKWWLFAAPLLVVLYPKFFVKLFGFDHGMWHDFGVLAMVGVVFFSLVFLVPDRNRLLENPAGDFFGKTSYSLYLLHLPVLAFLTRRGLMQPTFLSLIEFVCITSIAALISYVCIEAPSRSFLRPRLSGGTTRV